LGTGESFPFAFHSDGNSRKGLWQEGLPTNFLYCSNSLVTVGDAAICVDQYLERVTSRPSKTFNTKEGLLWKKGNACKTGKLDTGVLRHVSGDSDDENTVSTAETEPAPKIRWLCVFNRSLSFSLSRSLARCSPRLINRYLSPLAHSGDAHAPKLACAT